MPEIKKHKIAERIVKNIGKDMGKALLIVSSPITGALPARCQKYLEYRFGLDSGETTWVSAFFQLFGGVIACAYGEELGNSLISILGIYNAFEGAFRLDNKEARGSLMLKLSLLPVEWTYDYLRDKYNQAFSELYTEPQPHPGLHRKF